jgi:hypothetical protein
VRSSSEWHSIDFGNNRPGFSLIALQQMRDASTGPDQSASCAPVPRPAARRLSSTRTSRSKLPSGSPGNLGNNAPEGLLSRLTRSRPGTAGIKPRSKPVPSGFPDPPVGRRLASSASGESEWGTTASSMPCFELEKQCCRSRTSTTDLAEHVIAALRAHEAALPVPASVTCRCSARLPGLG